MTSQQKTITLSKGTACYQVTPDRPLLLEDLDVERIGVDPLNGLADAGLVTFDEIDV